MNDTSLAPPIYSTPEKAQSIANVLIVDPNFYYLQAFASSCMALPTTPYDFMLSYGPFPGVDIDAIAAFFQSMNDIGTTFGNVASLGTTYLQSPNMPASLLGQCNYAMAAVGYSSVFSAATNFGSIVSELEEFMQANLEGSDVPDYNGKNQRMIVDFLNNGGEKRDLPKWLDVVISIRDTLVGVRENFQAYGTKYDAVLSQNQNAINQLPAALEFAQDKMVLDGAQMTSMLALAQSLLDQYNKDMAYVDWTRDPQNLLKDIALFGPFGSVVFGIAAIAGTKVELDAQGLLDEWGRVESAIMRLGDADAQKVRFVRDLTGLTAALDQAKGAIESMCNSLRNIEGSLYVPLGNIASYNLIFFDNTAEINDLLEIPQAIAGWDLVKRLAEQFPNTCLAQQP